MVTVVLSPHLDDAVLSCWHVLTQPGEVAVINVFAGVPANADGRAWWDRYTGATDSAQRVRDRVEEDRRALALAGRGAVNLELLDDQYRHGEQPLAPVTARLKRLVAPGARVYAPAAFANHVDHARKSGATSTTEPPSWSRTATPACSSSSTPNLGLLPSCSPC